MPMPDNWIWKPEEKWKVDQNGNNHLVSSCIH